MLRKSLHVFLILHLLFLLPKGAFCQAPDLGTATTFALFTASGAFNNVGATVVVGDIGTNVGAFSGYPPGIVIGQIHVADAISAQAAADVDIAYSFLTAINCGLVLGTTLGNGQILTPNVYCLGAASVINGNLTLDAQGDPNALFIFQIDGALSTSTFSNVFLVNGASVCNIYWQVNGAFDLGDNSVFNGTLIAAGAISLNTGAVVNGRALSTAGAISTSANFVTLNPCCNGMQPTISCPAALSVSCAADVPAPNVNDPVVNGSGPFTVTFISDVISAQTCANQYTITRTYQVSDACSNTATCTQSITVNDQTPPNITNCPANVAVSCASAVPAVNLAAVLTSDNCNGVVTVSSADVISGQTCVNQFTIARTFNAADVCGNSAVCTQLITVNDQTPPGISNCPANVAVSCASDVPPANPAGITTTDNCGGTVTVSSSDVISGQICPNQYSISRTYVAEDVCGNADACIQLITVNDQAPPTITCPANVSVSCSSEAPAVNAAGITAIDNCGGGVSISVLADVISGQTCLNQYTALRTYIATDLCGNSMSCQQTITVNDQTPPAVVCPATLTVSCASLAPPATPANIAATDACGGAVTVTILNDAISNQTCPNRFTITRSYMAVDLCGNSTVCNQIITVNDVTPPVINCPADVTVECDNLVPAANPADVTSSDNCGGGVTVTTLGATISNFICPNQYLITRSYLGTDDCGNQSICNQLITVNDQTPPVLLCPTVAANIECPALPVFPDATATDFCSTGPVLVTFTDLNTPGGICAQGYSVTRTWMASDNCGNSTFCSRTITVTDNTAPIITCPTVPGAIECPALPIFPPPIASDLCDTNPLITFEDINTPSGICAQSYIVTRTWTATDACGNLATCQQTIAVNDLTPPVIMCPEVESPIECPATIANFGNASASDLCDSAPIINFSDATTPDGICAFSVTRTWTASDACGNSATCSRTVTVNDNTAPAINCPTVISPLECSAIPVSFPAATASDLCDVNPIITSSDITTPSGICPQEFTITRTWVATDNCGNSSSCSRSITVTDNTAPIITCPINLVVTCSGEVPLPNPAAVVATDLCGGTPVVILLSNLITDQLCINQYTVNRIYQATDPCGNSATCLQTILVNDLVPPVITCPANLNVTCIDMVPAAAPNNLVATDNCGGTVSTQLVSNLITNQLCVNQFTQTRIYSATDNCGNVGSCAQIITVFDNIPPTFVNPPPNATVNCMLIPPVLVAPTAVDNCSGLVTVLFLGEVQAVGICPTLYTLTRSWSAADLCGNITLLTQLVTVIDTVAPQFTTAPFDVVADCDLNLNPDGFQDWLDSLGGSVVLDCGAITWSFTDSPFTTMPSTCGGTSQRFIRFIATDWCGNSAFQDAGYTITDQTPPTFIKLPTNIAVECMIDCNGDAELLDWLEHFGYAEVSDACGSVTTEIAVLSEVQGCGNTWTRTYQFRATDDCGNTNYVTATFSIVDTTPPVIDSCPPGNIFLNCEFAVPLPDIAGVVASDNCGPVTVTVQNISTVGVGCVYWPLSTMYTYAVTDACGNVSNCFQSFQVLDSLPPIYTGPDTIYVACVEDLPAAGDVLDFLAPFMVDNCYDIICFASSVDTSDVNSVVYCAKAKDLCGNWTDKFNITFIATGVCKPICSVPQTIWGNPNGLINGTGTAAAIDTLLKHYGPIAVGKLGKMLTIDDADCVQSMLPGHGNTAPFHQGVNDFTAANNCLPGSPLLNTDGTLKNKLAANVLAMQLNILYNRQYNDRNLGVQLLATLPPCLVDAVIMDKVNVEYPTVQGLVYLANDYLAGVGAFPPNFGSRLDNVFANLNNYWLNCTTNNPCSSDQMRDSTLAGDNLFNLNLTPNPVQDVATITFELNTNAEIHVSIVGSSGIQNESIIQGVGGENILSFSTLALPAGIYTILLRYDSALQTLRMVKIMD